MQENELLKLAGRFGFEAAVLPASEVPTDGKFRHFCEENRCGQYHANYSCPPTCGTVEDMAAKIYAGTTALVLKTQWPIESYTPYLQGVHHTHISGGHNNQYKDTARQVSKPCRACPLFVKHRIPVNFRSPVSAHGHRTSFCPPQKIFPCIICFS